MASELVHLREDDSNIFAQETQAMAPSPGDSAQSPVPLGVTSEELPNEPGSPLQAIGTSALSVGSSIGIGSSVLSSSLAYSGILHVPCMYPSELLFQSK